MESEESNVTFAMLPTALRRYVAAVSLLGPLLAVSIALAATSTITSSDLTWIALLLPLLAVAERFPVHLTHKTSLNVSTAAYIALLLLAPWSLIGVVAVVAATIAQIWRGSETVEALFNVGQTGIYISIAALAYYIMLPRIPGAEVGADGSLPAIVLTSVVLHLVNSALVSGAGAFQLDLNPVRVWLKNLTIDLAPHVTLTLLGIVGATVVMKQPLFLPFLVLPGVFIHHAVKQTTKLRVDTHEALASLVEVMELVDPYTAGHSHRVAGLARILAHRYGLTAEESDIIEQAGRVHDIGKIGVETRVLVKPGKLNHDEWAQMRQHPVYGAHVISRFAVYRQIALLVRHHHESWDGSGYPDGLVGEAIPVGARILAVADTFDALTTNRPYRLGKTWTEAAAILQAGAGRQWDPRLVSVLLEYLRVTGGEVPTHRPTPSIEPGMIIENVA